LISIKSNTFNEKLDEKTLKEKIKENKNSIPKYYNNLRITQLKRKIRLKFYY
jgi:hypothetical protein